MHCPSLDPFSDHHNFVDIFFKAHLLDGRASAGNSVDSARQNLAATFANAFVNAGFDQVKLFRINFPVNADALLGVGIANCSIENDCDPVSALPQPFYLYNLNIYFFSNFF